MPTIRNLSLNDRSMLSFSLTVLMRISCRPFTVLIARLDNTCSLDTFSIPEYRGTFNPGHKCLRRNLPGLRVVVGQNYVPYCKLLCYCFKYLIKRNLF